MRTKVGSRDIESRITHPHTRAYNPHKTVSTAMIVRYYLRQADERVMKSFICTVFSTRTYKHIPSLPKYEIEPDTMQFY